jgi:hypothetical protein
VLYSKVCQIGRRIATVHFIKYGIYRLYFKMSRNFTYEVVGPRRRLKATIKNCISKIKCQFIF